MVQFGFYTLPLVMALLCGYLISYGPDQKKLLKRYVLILLGWGIYLFSLEQSGLLMNFSLPPRIPLLVVFPAIFLGIYLSGRASFSSALDRIPPHLIIYFQSFRILVELLIYGAFLNGILPQQVTFEGTNMDIIVGVSAIPVAIMVHKRKLSRRALLSWNVVSLMILAVTAGTFVYTFYTISLSTENMRFVTFPYLLLAAVLLPIAVFLHVISIRQLQRGVLMA